MKPAERKEYWHADLRGDSRRRSAPPRVRTENLLDSACKSFEWPADPPRVEPGWRGPPGALPTGEAPSNRGDVSPLGHYVSGNVKVARAPLTAGQIAEGIEECIESAHDLYHSGVILHRQRLPTTARALLILAVEEYAKIGWLYRALMLPAKSESEWKEWWEMFRSHVIKNEVGRMMMTHGDGLLPLLARFFRDRFPYFSVAPRALDLQKQAMLYVDFEPQSGNPVSPRKYAERQRVENQPLIEEVEQLVRYVARNRSSNVFHPEAVSAYRRVSEIAQDEGMRVILLQLFYGLVLKRPTGLVVEKPLDELLDSVRRRYPQDAADWVAWLHDVGQRIAG